MRLHRTTRAGFTMIELIIVMVIMSVLSAIAVPRIDFGHYRADGAAYAVRSTLQRAHRTAVARQHSVVVGFDVDGNRIRVLEDLNNNASADGLERVYWVPLEEGGQFTVPPTGVNGGSAAELEGITLDADGFPSIVFQRSGSASSDAEIYVGASHRGREHVRGLTIRRSTGRIDLFRHTGSKWHLRVI